VDHSRRPGIYLADNDAGRLTHRPENDRSPMLQRRAYDPLKRTSGMAAWPAFTEMHPHSFIGIKQALGTP